MIQRKTSQFELEFSQATAALAVRVADCGLLKQALDALRRIPYLEIGVETAITIARKANPEIRAGLLDGAEAKVVKALPSEACRLLAKLAQAVDSSERNRIIEKAVAIGEGIQETKDFSLLNVEVERAEAMLSIAPLLEEPRRTSFLLEAWQNAAKRGRFDLHCGCSDDAARWWPDTV